MLDYRTSTLQNMIRNCKEMIHKEHPGDTMPTLIFGAKGNADAPFEFRYCTIHDGYKNATRGEILGNMYDLWGTGHTRFVIAADCQAQNGEQEMLVFMQITPDQMLTSTIDYNSDDEKIKWGKLSKACDNKKGFLPQMLATFQKDWPCSPEETEMMFSTDKAAA